MSDDAANTSGRGRFRSMLVAMAGIGLALITFEAAFRQLLFGSVGRDPVTGAQVVTGRQRIGEGFGVSHRDGGIRLSPHGCSNCPQVLVIGDSYTDAFQVNDDEAYTAVAEAMLAGSKPVRLLNAGVAGSSPADYLVQAANYRRRIQPAWVIIELNADDLGPDAFRPEQVHFRQDGNRLTPVVPAPYAYGRITRTLGWIRENSALINYAITRLDVARNGAKGPPWFRAGFSAQVSAVSARPPRYPVERELSLLRPAYKDRVTFYFCRSSMCP